MSGRNKMSSDKKYLLSVYGSLKKGFHNHPILRDAKFLGTHVTNPEFTMYSLGAYPAITRSGNTAIHVEIYEVDESTLRRVYRLESYSGVRDSSANWYDTLDIDTPWGRAEMFYFKNSGHMTRERVVESGNWGLQS
jgi:gamma-glutamylcyclotransferase (GGCT)/AIG2-like uncharacterized protein YtfP